MRALRDERGVTAVIIAILMVVLLGMGAFVIDVGALYQERRELQKGADAGALAVAMDCAIGDSRKDCGSYTATADEFADANAEDGESNIDDVDIKWNQRTVTVETSTLEEDGATAIRYKLARVLGLNEGTVHAEATATWGTPGAAAVLPITFSLCEWAAATAKGSSFAEPQASGTYSDNAERTIYFHQGDKPGKPGEPATQDTAAAGDCDAKEAGGDSIVGNPDSGNDPNDPDNPGDDNTTGGGNKGGKGNADRLPAGFGWLDTTDTCETDINLIDGRVWIGQDPGVSPTHGCSPEYLKTLIGKTVLIPIFIDVKNLGQNGQYQVYGFAAFHFSGFNWGGEYTYPAASPPCSGSQRCMSGWFVKFVTNTKALADYGTVPDLGAKAVKLIG
jgi:Flp pilus assembly protein TadG